MASPSIHKNGNLLKARYRNNHNLRRHDHCLQNGMDYCNSSYSGGRDQEDYGPNPARESISSDPISKKPITKNGLVAWLNV
jgi:hypothetical protein